MKEPSAARRTLILDVADPTFFVDFTYAEDDADDAHRRAEGLRRASDPAEEA